MARSGCAETAAFMTADQLRSEIAPARVSPGGRRWSSYARCVDGAPLNSEGTGPDVSRADFVFCMTAVTWGETADEAAARLLEESGKARANGKAYAELTTRNAALAVERRRQAPVRSAAGSSARKTALKRRRLRRGQVHSTGWLTDIQQNCRRLQR
jgi:hypothetical protein